MTTSIRNLYDLQDRRIMMEKKLPPYGYALILVVAALLVPTASTVTWGRRALMAATSWRPKPPPWPSMTITFTGCPLPHLFCK